MNKIHEYGIDLSAMCALLEEMPHSAVMAYQARVMNFINNNNDLVRGHESTTAQELLETLLAKNGV